MKKLFSNPAICQILKFGVIGSVAFIIDNGIFRMLQLMDVNSHLAIAVGFTAALIFNYIFSTRWVFNSKRKQGVGVLLIFSVLSLIGFLLTEVLYTVMLMLFAEGAASDKTELAAKFASTFIVMIYNFVTRKLFLEK